MAVPPRPAAEAPGRVEAPDLSVEGGDLVGAPALGHQLSLDPLGSGEAPVAARQEADPPAVGHPDRHRAAVHRFDGGVDGGLPPAAQHRLACVLGVVGAHQVQAERGVPEGQVDDLVAEVS